MDIGRLTGDIEVFAGTFLVVAIIFFEMAYKKDEDRLAYTGIEFLVLSLHSLSIMHITALLKYEFKTYTIYSSFAIAIYCILKAVILYTKDIKNYLNSLSDISEIVKKEEPVKKEAKKRGEEVEELEEKETEIEKIIKEAEIQSKLQKEKNKKNKEKEEND